MATMYDSTHDDASPSRTVVEAVAAREGVEPTDLSPPLYTAIDPDVLDTVFPTGRESEGTAKLVFEYLGYEVTVLPDGSVRVANDEDESVG